jgi:threonyl-tRNA synthetase
MERFFGVLIEHYAGAFPFWLSPVQVALLPISEKHTQAVQKLCDKLVAAQFRAKVDLRNEKINLKIRRAQLDKVPFMLVIGDKEVENGMLSVRNRFDGDMGTFSFEKFLELIQHLKSTRAVRP